MEVVGGEGKYLKGELEGGEEGEGRDSIVMEVDWEEEAFKIYGAKGALHARKGLGELGEGGGRNGVLPVVKNAGNAGVEFSLKTL